MATVPAVHSVENTPTVSKPRRSDTEYDPVVEVNGKLRIAPAYQSMPVSKMAVVLAAFRLGLPEIGKRLSNCLICGSVFARTKFNRKLALAHKFPCNEIICANCGQAANRLRKWMRDKDAERIYNERRQSGIELSLPPSIGGEGYHRDREIIHAMTARLREWLGLKDSAVFDQAEEGKVRMIVPSPLRDCAAIRAKWREITGEDRAELTFRHPEGVTGQAAKRLYLWALEGFEQVHRWDPERQIELRADTRGLPLITCTGTYYRCLTAEEVAIRKEYEQQQLIESMERKGWQMEYIPYDQRIVENCEDIEDQYERVEYRTEIEGSFVYLHTNGTGKERASP